MRPLSAGPILPAHLVGSAPQGAADLVGQPAGPAVQALPGPAGLTTGLTVVLTGDG